MIDKKAHDRDGIYYIEFEKAKDAQTINTQLADKGYKVKEGYYFDGLEKKEDKYKFLWFYGKEYDALKDVRAKERKRDELIANGDMNSFMQLTSEFPEAIEKAPEVEALKYIKSSEDAQLYHETYPKEKLGNTEEISRQWVRTSNDLLEYRNLYGVSQFTDQKITELLPNTDEENAKVLLDHFYDSKHSASIEINYLSKVSTIRKLLKSEAAKKHFDISDGFNIGNLQSVKKLALSLDKTIVSFEDKVRLRSDLYDQHILSAVGKTKETISFKDLKSINDYVDSKLTWVDRDYIAAKGPLSVRMIHESKYQGFDFFEVFYADINGLLSTWNWKYGFSFLSNQSQIHSIRASKRESRESISSASTLEQIFFEEIYNKEFTEISPNSSLDDYSYVMMSGIYPLKSNDLKEMPFHVIFKLKKESKSYEVDELILSNLGSNQTYYDGKNKSQVYYYDYKSKKMKRRGK